MIALILLTLLLAALLIAGVTDRVILFRDRRDFGWMVSGPAVAVAGFSIAVPLHNPAPALIGAVLGIAGGVVSLGFTIRNNGMLLALPFFIIKLVLLLAIFALVTLAVGAVPVNSRRGTMAPIPSMLAVGMVLLVINGQRVALRREGSVLMRGLHSLR